MSDYTHGLVAVIKDPENEELLKVLAFAGYNQEPTQEDRDEVLNALKGHPEFAEQEFWFIDATQEMLDYFNAENAEENDSADITEESNS